MIRVRRAEDRGRTQLPWLDGRHTFSFGGYVDPEHHHFRSLRVINDDVIAPGGGFDTHPHHDMEIVTVVLDGALRHRDSMGNGSVIRPGEVQRMTAGTGVLHSEHNELQDTPTRLLQIWIFPESKGLDPGYEQKSFDTEARSGEWVLVASRDGREGSVTIHQDASIRRAHLAPDEELSLDVAPNRHVWLHVASGAVEIAGTTLRAGDGAAVSEETELVLRGVETADVLLFDLA